LKIKVKITIYQFSGLTPALNYFFLLSMPPIIFCFVWSGREDLNLRPFGPEPNALTRLRYAPAKRLYTVKNLFQQYLSGLCLKETSTEFNSIWPAN
jgi:hypothetical protein